MAERKDEKKKLSRSKNEREDGDPKIEKKKK